MKKSEETLLPLQNELLELEDSIRDEQSQIKAIKSRLIKNEKIIKNLEFFYNFYFVFIYIITIFLWRK